MANFYWRDSAAGLDTITPVNGDCALVVESGVAETYKYVTDAWVLQEVFSVVDDTTPQLGGDLDCNGHQINTSSYKQIADASLGTGTHTFDYSAGDMQQLTMTGDITLAFSNFVTGKVCTMIIDIVDGGDWTPVYPAGIVFSEKAKPTLTSGGTDRLLAVKDKDDVYSLFVVGADIGAVV